MRPGAFWPEECGRGRRCVDAGADLVADITEPLNLSGYRTATAFGVLEHIPEEALDGVLANLAACPRFVVTIHNGPARRWIGRQLHITRLPWPEWRMRLARSLVIEGEREAWPSRDGRLRLFYGRAR